MKRITVTAGLMLFTVIAHAGNSGNNNAANALFQELRQETINKQRNVIRPNEPNPVYDATRHPINVTPQHQLDTRVLKRLTKIGDYYYVGTKIGINAFHLKYLAILAVLGISAVNNAGKDNNSFSDDMNTFGKGYANPFQAGFRFGYFFKGLYGFIFDVEYNSFEFDENVGIYKFNSLQYIGFNLIPSVLIGRFLSFGAGIYTNFLVNASAASDLSLNTAKSIFRNTDFGFAASLHFYLGTQIKFFFGLEFKQGLIDLRKSIYRTTAAKNNMGFFMNAGIGF